MSEIIVEEVETWIHGAPRILGSPDGHLAGILPIVQVRGQGVPVYVVRNTIWISPQQEFSGAGADATSVLKADRGFYLDDDNVSIPQKIDKIMISPAPGQCEPVREL